MPAQQTQKVQVRGDQAPAYLRSQLNALWTQINRLAQAVANLKGAVSGSSGSTGAMPTVPGNTPAQTHKWLDSYDAATGVFTQTQPDFSDLSGAAASTQLPAATSSAIGAVKPDGTTVDVAGDGTVSVPVFVGDTGSGGRAGIVPAPAAGDAAAGKVLKADGSWYVPPGGGGAAVAVPDALVYVGDKFPSIFSSIGLNLGVLYQNSLPTGVLIVSSGASGGNFAVTGKCAPALPFSDTEFQQQAQFSNNSSQQFLLPVPAGYYYVLSGISDLISTGGRFYKLPSLVDSGDLVTSRAAGTAYRNTSGQLMLVLAQFSGVGAGSVLAGNSDGSNPPVAAKWKIAAVAGPSTVCLLVMPGDYYEVTAASGSLAHWHEYTISVAVSISANLAGVSRSANSTVYQNTGTKDVLVLVSWASGSTGTAIFASDGSNPPVTQIVAQAHAAGYPITMIGVAHPGEYYKLRQDSDGNPPLNFWYEITLG